jgi:hypothetical protein
MGRFRVVEERSNISRGGEVKSFLFGYSVWEYDDAGDQVQKMNQRVLSEQVARELAATLTWMVHLDAWMVTVVEDLDVTEEVAELLGLDDFPPDGEDDEEIEKAYDRMTAGALKFLPSGLRRLADRYEREWERVKPG